MYIVYLANPKQHTNIFFYQCTVFYWFWLLLFTNFVPSEVLTVRLCQAQLAVNVFQVLGIIATPLRVTAAPDVPRADFLVLLRT